MISPAQWRADRRAARAEQRETWLASIDHRKEEAQKRLGPVALHNLRIIHKGVDQVSGHHAYQDRPAHIEVSRFIFGYSMFRGLWIPLHSYVQLSEQIPEVAEPVLALMRENGEVEVKDATQGSYRVELAETSGAGAEFLGRLQIACQALDDNNDPNLELTLHRGTDRLLPPVPRG